MLMRPMMHFGSNPKSFDKFTLSDADTNTDCGGEADHMALPQKDLKHITSPSRLPMSKLQSVGVKVSLS